MTLSFDEFVAVLIETDPTRQVWLDIPGGLAASTMASRKSAQKFYDNWTLIGQPGLIRGPIPQEHLAFVQQGASGYLPPPEYRPPLALSAAISPAALTSAPAADNYPPPVSADPTPVDAVPEETDPDARAKARRSALFGFVIAAVGVAITAGTYAFSAPGQTFVVAYGAIIFGLIRGIRGLIIANRS